LNGAPALAAAPGFAGHTWQRLDGSGSPEFGILW